MSSGGQPASRSGKRTLLWTGVVVVVLVLVGLRFAPRTTADPLDADAVDRAFHIGLKSVPSGWGANWAKDDKSPRRLSLSQSKGSAAIQVLAFKGDLNEERFADIGALLYGQNFPRAVSTADAQEYGSLVRRSIYREKASNKTPIYTTIDVLWHEAETTYAYVIIARSIHPEDLNIKAVKASLSFSPPRLNLLGRAGSLLGAGFEFLEFGVPALTWLGASVWGAWYLARKLDERWKPAKYLVGIGISVLALGSHMLYGVSWLTISVVVTLAIAACGVATALLSGAWHIEE